MHLHTNPKTIENFSLFLINESVSLFLSGRRLISQSLAPELQAIEEENFNTNRHPLTWSQLAVNDGCFLQTAHNTGHDAQAKAGRACHHDVNGGQSPHQRTEDNVTCRVQRATQWR